MQETARQEFSGAARVGYLEVSKMGFSGLLGWAGKVHTLSVLLSWPAHLFQLEDPRTVSASCPVEVESFVTESCDFSTASFSSAQLGGHPVSIRFNV